MLRKAEKKDIARIAEIIIFTKRHTYRDIFKNDHVSFNVMQVLSEAETYSKPHALDNMFVYDDGIVKAMINAEITDEKITISDFYVDKFFQGEGIGTYVMKEFEKMCKALHEHEIGVMFDLVPCHVSNQHRWFKEHPEYFIWSDEKRGTQKAYGNLDQSSENAWHWSEEHQKYYYAPFSQYMPSLNLDNEEVRKMLVFTARFWINKGVDSFRLDAIIHSHINTNDSVDFFEWFREQVPVYMVGEAWSDYYTIGRYSSVIDSCFDFPLQGNLAWSTRNLDFLGLAGDLNRTYSNLTLFTSNHDMDRIGEVLGQDEEKIKLYLWLNLLFAQGQHCLYYMDEVGIGGTKCLDDINVRPEMDWDLICKQMFTPDSILREYLRAVKLIDKYEVLSDGKIVRVEC